MQETPSHLPSEFLNDRAGVSVIVCCYNSAKRLPETLQHLAKQRINDTINCEIVLVDNGSTDDSAQIAQGIWASLGCRTPLRLISESRPGLSFARAAGVQNATYEFLIFCDDDNWLHEEYVQGVYERLSSDSSIGVLGGRNIAAFETPPPAWFEQEKGTYAIGEQGSQTGDVSERKFIYGAGMALRKSVWGKLQQMGYRSFLTDRKGNLLSSGGDSEICIWHIREGYTLFYDANLVLEHFIENSRLQKDYLKRLEASMYQANATLRIYHSLLEKQPDVRNFKEIFSGLLQLVSGIIAYPFSRKTGLRKLAKAQISFGTKLKVSSHQYGILSYYSAVGGCGEIARQPRGI